MLEPVHAYSDVLQAGATLYQARVYGNVEETGSWGGYLVFVPVGDGRAVMTERETTQRSLAELASWARTLSWVYLEGALNRALARQPEVQLVRRLAEIEREEREARAEAEALTRAAESARAEADVAHDERLATARVLAKAIKSTGRRGRRKRQQ